MTIDPKFLRRITSKIRYEDGHHVWTGSINPLPMVWVGRNAGTKAPSWLVHRTLWEDKYGAVPTKLYPLCAEPLCVNIEHWTSEPTEEFRETFRNIPTQRATNCLRCERALRPNKALLKDNPGTIIHYRGNMCEPCATEVIEPLDPSLQAVVRERVPEDLHWYFGVREAA